MNKQTALYAILASFWFSLMICGVRFLSNDYNAFTIVFWRLVFALFFMLPWLYKNGISAAKTKNIKLYLLRSSVGIIGMLLWFYSLTKLALPQATALSFTAPIFSVICAIIFLKEKVTKNRVIAMVIAFFATLLIIRPGFDDFNSASFIVIFATITWAFASILLKN
jgi:drug/metabolite transporter (DMT)-like permease